MLEWRWLDGLTSDARYACRVLVRRDRASSVAAVVMLALAIGLNGIVFTIVDAMLVRGFPLVKDNDRLVMVQEIFPSHARAVSFPDFDEWRAHVPSFEGMCAVASGHRVAFRDQHGGRPVDLPIWTVTTNTFGLLGVAPVLGRDFVRADEVPGASPVVILGYRFWATRFGKNAEVVGSTVFVGGVPATVVGVMPERFEFPHESNFWMPAVRTPELELVYVLARARVPADQVARPLRAGIERLDADVAIEALMTLKASFAFDGDYMDLDHMELGKGAAAAPIFAGVALILAALGLYAVIAHAVSQRTHEIGVRIAIGAAASDIRALVFRDGMTPVALGIAGGLAASSASNRLLQSQLVGVSPFDPATIANALLLLIAVALMACGVPAGRAIRVNPAVALRQE